MTPKQFVGSLQLLKFENVFNPYADRCPVHDVSDAPARRSKMLLMFLEAAVDSDIDALWIGRDLGYRGGRRTGLALTDDVHLTSHATRWGLRVERATTGSAIAERTAAVIWTMLMVVPAPIFLWNVFPLHPHEANDPFSNRSHKQHERIAGEEILAELIVMLRPRRLIAIGNDAAKTAMRLAAKREVNQVRHPSYGGQRDFIQQVESLYDVKAEAKQMSFL